MISETSNLHVKEINRNMKNHVSFAGLVRVVDLRILHGDINPPGSEIPSALRLIVEPTYSSNT